MDHLTSHLKVNLAQHSDKGEKPENQDTVGARIPEGTLLVSKGIALAVADGVSSSISAKQASQTAVTGFLTDYYATPDTWSTQHSATTVIHSLNRYLWGQSRNSVLGEGHLTTFTTAIFKGDACFIFHIGDTRVYRYRNDILEQLTTDHTQKIDKNTTYLSRALGADLALEIEIISTDIKAGDLFLLTSDGVHDVIPHASLCELLEKQQDPATLVETITELAHSFCSSDNISIQVAHIEQTGQASQQDAIHVLSRLPFPPFLQVGQHIDGFKVEKILHESERSQVYVVQNADRQRFVMKTPSVNYLDDPAYIERFVMEAWIGARIQSPNVVRVVQPTTERKFLYYLTEHVAGPTLGQLIKERAPMPIPDAIELLEILVKATRAFHRKDTLHQDIKPENIIVGANGPTLIDFGSCWVAGIQEASAPFVRDKILGTLNYSAPEYRYGGRVSQRSDQFSLAIIFYEMLTGQHPYGDAYERAMSLKAFQRLKYIPARKHNPLVPFWLDKAIEKALGILPSARYSAMSEWLVDVKRPNASWRSPQEMPLMARNPVTVWQVIAAAGWIGFITMLINKFAQLS